MQSALSHRRGLGLIGLVAASALALSGCTAAGGGTSDTLTVGTTDKITSIDPAGAYDNGSFAVMNQVYPFLMNTPYGSPDVQPDIAESASFTAPTEYTVKLKPGLKFANGNDLTSTDVKFSFDRQKKINDPNGPSSLLFNLSSVDAPDPTTVVFHLTSGDDQTFPQVLSSPAGPIVDHEVFSADKVTPDNDIVKGNGFAGQYQITSYKVNELVSYKAFPGYKGVLGEAKTANVNTKYYTESSNLKLDIQQGNIDVAFRSLSATDIDSLRKDSKVKVVDGPGGEIRYIVYNFNTMNFGATTATPDPAKALAVRQAMADLIDRKALSEQVYKGTFTPLYSYVPAGLTGATETLKTLYGDGNGGPSVDKAKQVLEAAGIPTPVDISLQYNTDHYGPGSSEEYAMLKDQFESSGLFKVNLQSTEYVQYSKDRVKDIYPMYQLGWFPDYSDADNYLTPFFLTKNFINNHFEDQTINDLILKQAVTTDKAQRTQTIEEIQAKVGALLPTLPFLQGSQVAITGTKVTGADKTLDASFKFRYGALAK